MLIVREFSNRFQQMSGMPINSNETKERLKAAGIDINSKQYRAVMSEMSRDGGGGYTTISAIKKRQLRQMSVLLFLCMNFSIFEQVCIFGYKKW